MSRRCGCAGSGCACKIVAGTGIEIEGTGTADNPYRIVSSVAGIGQSLKVESSGSLRLTMLGEGTPTDPFVIRGVSSPALVDLADVHDAQPVAGDVPVWVDDPDGDHWEFMPPPTTEQGAVTTGAGLLGDGSGPAPLKAAVSGTWGTTAALTFPGSVTDTAGAPVYADSTGALRTVPQGVALRSSSAPQNIEGRFWYKSDSAQMFWGNGTTWNMVGAGGGTVTDQDIADAVEAYFVANPATLNDATVAGLIDAPSSETHLAINDLVVSLLPSTGGGGGSFDPAQPQTITGAWNFTTAPTLPNGSITTAKIANFTTTVQGIVDATVSGIVGAAPALLNTLDELAAAIGDDPNFRNTLLTEIGTKATDSAVVHLTGTETISGNKTLSGATTFSGTVSFPAGGVAKAAVAGLTSDLNLKADKASPTFTGTVTAANLTVTGLLDVPAGSLSVDDVATLQATLTAILDRLSANESTIAQLVARPTILYVENEGDTHPDARSQDLSVYRAVEGGTTPPPPTLFRKLWLAGLADNTALPQAGGTGDTALSVAPAGSPFVQTVDSLNRVHVPAGTSAITWRWTGLTLGTFGIEFEWEPVANPTTSSTIFVLTGVMDLVCSATGTLTMRNSTGTTMGTPSPVLALDNKHKIRIWRDSVATGGLTRIRILNEAGTQVWPTVAQGGTSHAHDVGVANGTQIIMGRTGTASGEHLWSKMSVSETGAELIAA